MNCLKKYVGLKYCSMPEPKSGTYVNALPGIQTELVAAIAKKEQDSFDQMWDDVNSLAYDRIKLDIANYLLQFKKVNFNEVVYQTGKLSVLKPVTAVTSSQEWQGYIQQVPYSKYGKVYLKSVQFYVQTIIEALIPSSIEVYDLATGQLLIPAIPVTPVVGYNLVEIGLDIEVPHDNLQLYVRLDTANLSLLELQEYAWKDRWGIPVCGCESPTGCDGPGDWKSYAAEGDLVSPMATSTALIFVSMDVQCSIDAFICDNVRQFTSAWQYLLGHELMKQKLGTYKLGYWANSNLEMTRDLKDSFYTDYSAHIKRIVQTIPLETEGLCYNCEGVSGYTYDSIV